MLSLLRFRRDNVGDHPIIEKIVMKKIDNSIMKRREKYAQERARVAALEWQTAELARKNINEEKENSQIKAIIDYQKANIFGVEKILFSLKEEVNSLNSSISSVENSSIKLTHKEKSEYRNQKNQLSDKLKYLYIATEFFTLINKLSSGFILSKTQQMLIIKFFPFFEGKPVLDIDYEDEDDEDDDVSASDIFDEYLETYDDLIEARQIPNIDDPFNIFKAQCSVVNTIDDKASANRIYDNKQPVCRCCGEILPEESKFCPYCGTKYEEQKNCFCSECGAELLPDARFCMSCGHKVTR